MSSAGSRGAAGFRPYLWGCVAILFGAFALRLWNLGAQSLWHDEGWSVFAAFAPFAPMGIRSADVNAPAVFYASIGLWANLTNDSVWSMRYWSLIVGVVGVAAAMWAGRRLGFGRDVALLAGVFTAFSPILWVFSQEIRAYIPIPLAATILLVLAGEWLFAPDGKPSRRVWLWLPVVEILMLYMQNLAVPVVAWLNVTIIGALVIRREWRRIPGWLAVQIVLLVAYLPWLITQRQTGTPLNTPPALAPSLIADIWASYFTGIKPLMNADGLLSGLIAAFGGVGLIATAAALLWRRSGGLGLVISQVVLLPVFQLAIIRAANIDFHPRYFIPSAPATLILIAVGVVALAEQIGRLRLFVPIIQLIGNGVKISVAMLAIGIMGRMGTLVAGSPLYQHDNFRAIAEYYAQLGEDTALIFPYQWEPSIDYYRAKLPIRAPFVEIPLHSRPDRVVEMLQQTLADKRYAEVLTWYQLPADVRGLYPCLLSTVGRHVGEYTVSGIKTDRYELDPEALARFSTLQWPMDDQTLANFGPVRLIGAAVFPPSTDGQGCAALHWAVDSPTEQVWRATVRLSGVMGEIALGDSDIMADNQTPTNLWRAGGTGWTFTRLDLPPTLPNSTHQIQVGVYRMGGERLRTVGVPALSDVPIGEVRLAPQPLMATPAPEDRLLGPGLYLHSAELPAETDRPLPGLPIMAQLELWVTGAGSYRIGVTAEGEGWQTAHAEQFTAAGPSIYRLAYRLRLPPGASGSYRLYADIPGQPRTLIGTGKVQPLSRVFEPPTLDGAVPVGARFGTLAELVSAAVPAQIAAQGGEVRLVWQAAQTGEENLIVFVHLVAPDGRIVAQSDRPPANGARPTLTWLAGEYLIDVHPLRANIPDYRGPAVVRVGLYDPVTGQRVLLPSGAEFADVASNVQVIE